MNGVETLCIYLILGTTGHTGYSSCTYCWQIGCYCRRRVVFESQRGRPRTDTEFRNQEDGQHHIATTSLTENPLIQSMIFSFPIDHMHTLDLGVMRKILMLQIKYHVLDVDKADEVIKKIAKYVPTDFTRKPRSMKLIEHWKASEFRMFALYIAPIMYLECDVDEHERDNFLKLFISYRLLMGENGTVTDESLEQADELLNEFVQSFKQKYSELSFNFHALLHLAEIVRLKGPLYKYSAYKYENFYQLLRSWIRKPSHLFQQIWTRWLQTRGMVQRKKGQKRKFDSFYIDFSIRNNCVMNEEGDIFIIHNKIVNPNGIFLEGKKVNSRRAFFDFPINSENLNIFIISETNLSVETTVLKLESVTRKMFKIPFKNNLVIMPVLHY